MFLSYRRADTGDLARRLSELLDEDLGSSNVFRDEDDLVAGTKWSETLVDAIADSDAAAILIGPEWMGPNTDGTRRIDDVDDPVASEVRQVLRDGSRCQPLPILIDMDSPPSGLPSDLQPLFDHHAVSTTRDGLLNSTTKGYQSVLVGVWESIRQRTPRGVLIIGDDAAMAQLDAVVDEMKNARLIDARRLSRFASGAYVVSARRWRKGARKWPDAIIIVGDDSPSETLRSRIQAVNDNTSIRAASLVGAGVMAGFAISQVLGASGASAATAFSASSQVLPAIPQIGTGPAGAISTVWVNATRAAKIAFAAGTVAVAGVSTVAVTQVNSSEAVTSTYGYLGVELGSARSTSDAPREIATGEPAVYVTVDLSLDNPLRDVSFSVPTEVFSLEAGGEFSQAKTVDGDDIELLPQRETTTELWFTMPAGTSVDNPVLTMRERGAEPLVLSFTAPDDIPERVPVSMSGDFEIECRMITFGPGFASYNAGLTDTGDGRPGPDITQLGRAAEDELLISFEITATERCTGPLEFYSIRYAIVDTFTAILESRVGERLVPTANSRFGQFDQIDGDTIDGYLTASVPEDSVAPLEIDFYVRDGQPTTLQADLAGIGAVVASQ